MEMVCESTVEDKRPVGVSAMSVPRAPLPVQEAVAILLKSRRQLERLPFPEGDERTPEAVAFALALRETIDLLSAIAADWQEGRFGTSQLMNTQHTLGLRQVTNQEQERRRLADRLRNGPAHLLANVVMELRSSLHLFDTEPSVIRPALESLIQEIEEGLQDLREIIEDLRIPLVLKDMGFLAWLQDMAQRYSQTYGLTIRVEAPPAFPRLPQPVEVVLFRVTQEAIRNVLKHAQATEVVIRLQLTHQGVRLEFEDNGRGFDPDALPWIYAVAQPKETFGLHIMRGLAETVRGTLEVASRLEQGTLLTLEIPLPPGVVES